MTRNGVPIENHPFKTKSKPTGIRSRNGSIGMFSQYRAFVANGATIEELWKLRQGQYPKWFVGEIIALYELNISVKNHIDDANALKIKGSKK